MSDMPPPPPDDSGWSSEPPPPPGSAPGSPEAAEGWATLGTGERVELAGAGSRLGARIIDWIILLIVSIILIVAGVLALVGLDFEDTDETEAEIEGGLGVFVGIVLALFAIGLLYEVALIATRGQTLGKMATKIRVVRADNGFVPGWGKSLGRWLVPAAFGILGSFIPFVGLVALLVYASILWGRNRQGWHDKAAGTLVIKT